MTEEQLREQVRLILNGGGYYDEIGRDVDNLMSLFTKQLELAKIEAKIEELKSLDFDDVYDRRNKVVVTFGEIEDRVAELTKQKDLLTKESK